MPLNISRPQKIVNNIVYENTMPSIDSTHASITKIATITKTGSSTGSAVYTVYVYNDTAMFCYDNKFVKFDMKTQTSTIIQFSSFNTSNITGMTLSPDLSGMYTTYKSSNTYSMTYFSFEDGSMTQLYDSDYISAIYSISCFSFQTVFIGDNYIIYPKHDRMYTNERNTCKIYMSSPSSDNTIYPSITEIASINIGSTSYDRFEIVNMNINEFKNNRLRYTLLATCVYNLESQPYGFYNEYDIVSKSFWVSDKTGLGSPIQIKYNKSNIYTTISDYPAFLHVPFIYVDSKYRVAVPTLSGGTTVINVPQRDAGYKSSTEFVNENDTETVTIIESLNSSYYKILWGFNNEHGCFRTDKTPNGYYFESYTTYGDNEVGLYYLECLPDKGE